MLKRSNSMTEFSFQLTAVPTHYCPSDNGSIYNTTGDSEPICYLRQPEDGAKHNNVPDGISNCQFDEEKSRATPPQSTTCSKRFPSRSLSDSVLVVKDKATIIPSWKPQTSDEKPPYSYATLIAYAILSSPDRKLPLCDIYMTISGHFPYYVLGDNGWQNSIRHNLSLNKSFIKLERKPSDARPGKGSYWTIVDGHEQTFIDSLTRPGGPLRKQTVNVGKRTMSTNNSMTRPNINSENLLIMGPQDFEKCSKPTHSITTSLTSSELVSLPDTRPITRPKPHDASSSSSMITIFRMAPMVNNGYRPARCRTESTRKRNVTPANSANRKRRRSRRSDGHDNDSDCDSGVDVRNEFVPSKLLNKKNKVDQTPPQAITIPTTSPYHLLDYTQDLLLSTADSDMSYLADCDSPISCTLSSFLDEPSSPVVAAAGTTSFSVGLDCEFEENLLLTQSSSLYSQEEEDYCWTTDYLTW